MKSRHIVGFAILALIAGIALISCNLQQGTSIDSRIKQFVDSLNGDRTQTYKQLVPNSQPYNANNGVSTFWDANFPSGDGPFTFSFVSSSPYDQNDTEVDITFTAISTTKHYKFVLQTAGSVSQDWYIVSLYINLGSWTKLF